MFKLLMLISIFCTTTAFAQNMAGNEDWETSYQNMPDGSSRYVGKCSTHEDYEKIHFVLGKSLQDYVDPDDLTEEQMSEVLAKFDKEAIEMLLKAFSLYEVGEQGESEVSIFKNYVDDFFADVIIHKSRPQLKLIRFGMGVGGGNGGYVVLNQVKKGSKITYQLMSYTFDSDLNYCDKKVWLQK